MDSSLEIPPNLYCESCNVKCSRTRDFIQHISTRKHILRTGQSINFPTPFKCELCDTVCRSIRDLNKHNLTRRHIYRTENPTEISPTYSCSKCKKMYKAKNSLWYHMKRCTVIPQDNITIEPVQEPHDEPVESNLQTNELIPFDNTCNVNLESETDEDINAQIIHLLKYVLRKNEELSNQVTNVKKDVMNHLDIVANTLQPSNVTNNNNNTQFNMNFFLNEQCKDAVNVSDFIESLELNFADLQTVAEKGFILGNYEIIKDKFSELGIYRRPIHCSDLKRETVYVRENNEWQKEASDHPLLKKLIVYVAHRVSQQCTAWHHENPDFMQSQEKKDLSLLFMNSSFGVNGKSDSENKAKIAKNVLEFVEIDKRRLK